VTQLGQLQLASFINNAGLQSQGENLFIESAASGAPQVNNPGTNGIGVLNQSFVETSNVNVAEELVNMIIAQRAFELNSRAITTSDQMLQRLTQL
jgi:flagellar basal-body rod protein FlgG